MIRNAPLAAIMIMFAVLVQFSWLLALGEGRNSNQEIAESLAVMAAQDPSEDDLYVENYINRTKAEPSEVVLHPSNPKESRANWQRGMNGNFNDSMYLDLMKLVGNQYIEDLNYSSYILDKFVKKEIDAREAMTSTMTLFVLTSETVDMVDQIKPPSKFEEYQNATQLALINLEGYLWNMGKFYETNRRVYAMQAHDNFNMSMEYYEIFSRSSEEIDT